MVLRAWQRYIWFGFHASVRMATDQKGENMIRKLMAAVALTAVLLMTGCASVPMANKDADAKAKQFAPSKGGMAELYIYRSEVMGAAIKMPVLIDGVSVGDTVAKAYIFKTLPAGSHTIISKAENDSSLTIDMVAGQTYFVWQEVKMGVLYARSKLHQVDETTGEDGVRECDLVKGDGSSETALAEAPLAAPTTAPATIAVATADTPTPAPVTETTPLPADPSPQPAQPAAAELAQPSAPIAIASTSSPDSAASVALAQSVANGMGCGEVQANGASTFIAPCGTYGVLIDCDGDQCRPMHTVKIKNNE
jgi:uncharacterized protein DUF2846